MKKSAYTSIFVALLGIVVLLQPVFAQDKVEDITVGKTMSLYSDILDEERKIRVALPNGYEENGLSYPVLFILDADWDAFFINSWSTVEYISDGDRTPQMIVVGICNTVRNRDMIPLAIPDRANSGGSDNFLNFISDELLPRIRSEYRTVPLNILYGGSNAGLLTVYALLARPDIFFAGISGSPMIGHCSDFMRKTAESAMKSDALSNRQLYMIYGENDYSRVLNDAPGFYEYISGIAPEGFRCDLVELKNEGHVPLSSLEKGLSWLFHDWKYTDNVRELTSVNPLRDHYTNLSEKYGFEIPVPLNVLIEMGYFAIQRKDYSTGKTALQLACKNYPASPDAAFYLGRAYEEEGNIDTALVHYRKALKADPDYTAAARKIDELSKK